MSADDRHPMDCPECKGRSQYNPNVVGRYCPYCGWSEITKDGKRIIIEGIIIEDKKTTEGTLTDVIGEGLMFEEKDDGYSKFVGFFRQFLGKKIKITVEIIDD